MFKINSISLAASLALVGSLTLVGCGSGATDNISSSTGETSSSNAIRATGSISGNVNLVNNPTDRTMRTTNATAQIVAYNLDDNTKYTTTSTSQGAYSLNALTEGNYQVIATSTSTTMRSVRQVEVLRDTRAVVDIVLQATGIVKGKIDLGSMHNDYYGSNIVTIPGTSYISTLDRDGNFELINVPSGEVTIAYNDYYKNITVKGGEETIVNDLADYDAVRYVNNLQTNSTLEMRHEGIRIDMRRDFTLAEFKELVSFENNASEAVAINVDFAYRGSNDENYTSFNFKIETKSVVDPGDYTLKIKTTNPYEKKITLQDKVAVFGDTFTNTSGVYEKSIGLAFSKAVTDLNASKVTVTYVDDANTSKTLAVIGIEADKENVNEYQIIADFDSGVKYQVVLDDSIKENGLFYSNDIGFFTTDGITLGNTRVGYSTISDEQKNVSLDEEIRFNIYEAESLDLKTLSVMLGDENLTLQNGGLTSISNNSVFSFQILEVKVNNSSLSYSKDVTMSITAKDSYGDTALDNKISFKTITPATVGVLPYVEDPDDFKDFIASNIRNMNSAILRAYFNVEVDTKSGKISLRDNTNNKDVMVNSPTSSYATYSNNTSTPYNIEGFPTELLPNTEYTMTVSGYTATDGTAIEAKTNTFKTPSRIIVSNSVRNGLLVDSSFLNNRIVFTTFGKLTEAEKQSIANGLTITSFTTALEENKTHPKPIALWDDNSPYGSRLVLAFTIDKGTSYELDFNGDVAKELGMTDSPLTFMTVGEMVSGDFTPFAKIVDRLNLYIDQQDYNLSKVSKTMSGTTSVSIPYILDEEYNSDSSNKCSNLRYKNISGYSGYDDTPDVNASLITEWMVGNDLNTSSTSLSGMHYFSRSFYDENNNYKFYYTCNITYNANFTISNETNSSVSISVPDSYLKGGGLVANGFVARDTNETKVAYSEETGASVHVYNNSFHINFSKPVLLSSLEAMEIKTNPDLNIKPYYSYAPYFDKDGNNYTMSFSGPIDSSVYSAFKYDINSTVVYYDVMSQSAKDLNITQSGIVYTDADLLLLEVTMVAPNDSGSILLDVSRSVDLDSVLTKDNNGTVISSAFTLTNENNESNVTATITGAYNSFSNYNGTKLKLNVERSDSGCANAMNFTLEQKELIKAEGSSQTLEAGSVKESITLPEDKTSCPAD